MKCIVIYIAVLMLSVNSFGEVEVKGTPNELSDYLNGVKVTRTVTLTAQSEIKVDADRAVVMLAVTTDNPMLTDALKANQSIREKLIKTLKDTGIDMERIKTSQFSSTPDYGWFRKKPKSYKVENQVMITIENENEFQKVAQIIDKFLEVEYRGIKFEQSEKSKLKRQATEKALDAVMEKKKLYEDRLGLQLVPINFNQEQVHTNVPQDQYYGGDKIATAGFSNIAQVMEDESGITSFGEVIFYGIVSVEFKVETKQQ